ncbi:hypothetical protein ACFYZ8_20735 [Streptomyces sp. NPDC001668]
MIDRSPVSHLPAGVTYQLRSEYPPAAEVPPPWTVGMPFQGT